MLRARDPDEGFIERTGPVLWERYGDGEPTVLLLPTWSLVHAAQWKCQVPYLARHFRVVVFDGRGQREVRPPGNGPAYDEAEFVADALAVLDATGTDRAAIAVLPGRAAGPAPGREPPGARPGAVFVAPSVPIADPGIRSAAPARFDDVLDTDEGWAKYNRHYWLRDCRGFAEFFFGEIFTEPHSTKQIEDAVGWALDTDAETLIADARRATRVAERTRSRGAVQARALPGARRARRPTTRSPLARGVALAELTGGALVTLEGAGHCRTPRDPVHGQPADARLRSRRRRRSRAERAVRAVARAAGARCTSPRRSASATRGATSPSRASCARCTRTSRSTGWRRTRSRACSRPRGERVHPASASWRSESRAHRGRGGRARPARRSRRCGGWTRSSSPTSWSSTTSCATSATTCGSATRRGTSTTSCTRTPSSRRAPFAWLTDFVGWLPMPDGGEREAFARPPTTTPR